MERGLNMKTLLMMACLGSMVSACEMKQNLDEMHKATVQMSDTTKRMEEKTTDLDTKTESLDAKTAELYDALRQGNSSLLRKEFLEQLTESKEMAKKLSFGVKYFWAFEFQLWSMQGLDDDHRREELASCAAREFIREVHEYAPTNDFISPTTDDNNEKNFLVLATTLHEVNDKQKTRIDKAGLQRMSMLTLIERALTQKKELQEGKITVEQLAPSSYDLLAFEEKLVQLLQARHNFILTMLVAKASHIDQGWTNKIKLGLLGMKWTLDLSHYNAVEITEMKRYIQAVIDTRAILTRAGYPVVVDSTIMKIVANGQAVKSKSANSLRQKDEAEILQAILGLKTAQVQLK